MYKDGERFGPGIATYVDGTCDVGLWYRERLIKLCVPVNASQFSLEAHGHSCNHTEHRKRIPKVVRVRSCLESASRVALSLYPTPEPMINYVFESDPEDIAKAMVSDILPVSSLAADLHSYDKAFFTDSKSLFHSAANLDPTNSSDDRENGCKTVVASGNTIDDGVDANLTSSRNELVKSVLDAPTLDQELEEEIDGDILAWNNTASCVAMQINVLRHRSAQSTIGFDVDSVVAGNRGGSTTAARGVVEIASERFILAADAGDLATVAQMLNNGDVNVDVSDSAGRTALFAAVVRLRFIFL